MNNEHAFKKAYDEHSNGIFRFCYFRIGERELAKEITQEAFLRTWQALIKGTKIDSLKSYLYRVAHNLLVNELRKKHPLLTLDDEENDEPADEVETKTSDYAEQQLLVQNINKLSPKYSEVLRLKLSGDLNIEEIATILGKSKNNTTVLIHRATEKLKKFYE